ncbi:MAG: hypothetical protein ACR2RV_27870 [Verrucomicrobiales bacterium]
MMKLLPTALLAIGAATAGFIIGQSKSGRQAKPDGDDTTRSASRLTALTNSADPQSADTADAPIPGTPETTAQAVEQIRGLLEQKQSVRRDLQFTIAALSLDAESLALAWGELQALTGFNDYANEHALTEALLTRWAEIDPDGAVDATSKMTSWMRQEAVGTVAKNWAKHSPGAALAWAKSITNSQFRQHAVGETLDQIGKSDRAGALELYMEALEDRSLSTDRWNSGAFFADWGREDPTAAAAAAVQIMEENKSDNALSTAIGAWAFDDTPAALAWLSDELKGDTQRRMLRSVYESWSQRDPLAAANHMLAQEDSQKWRASVDNVVRNWVMRDFDATSTWIDGIDDPDRQSEARAALIQSSGWSGSDVEAADYALQFIDDPKTKDALANLAWGWSQRDADGALAWAEENIDDPALVDRMRFQAIQTKIWENPALAAEKLSDLPEGKQRQEFYSRVANDWASSNLESARQWANDLPEGVERDLALSSVTGAWIADDTEAATDWIGEMETGDLRDQMVAKLAQYHAGEADIEAALDAAQQVDDPLRRANTLESTLRTWMYREPEAARGYIEASEELDAQTRWRLLTPH